VEICKRAYVLTPAGRASARARAARRANLEKARAAAKEIIYRPTPRRQAASRANLEKALAARRRPEGNARARLNALKHGLFARLVPESVPRLDEDPDEFAAHQRRFAQIFAPEDEMEQKVVRRLAETTWRRLRLHRAQARWEADRLREFFADAPAAARLTPEETERRAYALADVFTDFQPFFTAASRLEAQVERVLRQLLHARSGGAIKFKVFAPRRESLFDDLEEWPVEELIERMRKL